MKKNILIVNITYFPDLGGAGIVAKNTAEELIKSGYNVTVFCGGKIDKTEEINKVKVIRNNTSKNNSPYVLGNYYNPSIENKFLKVIKENNIEIIHFHSIQGLGANLIELSLKRGIKTILTMHDFWWECPMLFLNDEYLSSRPVKNHEQYCNGLMTKKALIDRKNYLFSILENNQLTVTTVSESIKQSFEYIGLPNSSKFIPIENGINQNLIKNDDNRFDTNNNFKFAYFGGENISKGFGMIFKASKILKYNYNNFEIHCFGIHRPFLKQTLNYNLLKKHRIYLHGVYDNYTLPSILSQTNVVLIPSQMYESFSLISRESLLNNKIIISSNMGGLSEIKSKKHLIYVKNSSFDLAKKMFYSIKHFDKLKKLPVSIKYITLNDQVKLFINIYEN